MSKEHRYHTVHEPHPPTPVSDRIRPNVEAAPWVIKEFKNLEEAFQGVLDRRDHWCSLATERLTMIKTLEEHLRQAVRILRAYEHFESDCSNPEFCAHCKFIRTVEPIIKKTPTVT